MVGNMGTCMMFPMIYFASWCLIAIIQLIPFCSERTLLQCELDVVSFTHWDMGSSSESSSQQKSL